MQYLCCKETQYELYVIVRAFESILIHSMKFMTVFRSWILAALISGRADPSCSSILSCLNISPSAMIEIRESKDDTLNLPFFFCHILPHIANKIVGNI